MMLECMCGGRNDDADGLCLKHQDIIETLSYHYNVFYVFPPMNNSERQRAVKKSSTRYYFHHAYHYTEINAFYVPIQNI